jgi:hypothetical protein
MIMMELNILHILYFCIGFILIVGLTHYVYLKYIGFSPLGHKLTLASRAEIGVTNAADAELMNVIAFVKLCSACLSEDAYRTLLAHKLITDIDYEALNTLVSLGICQEHAQFICNYFLAQNLEYPGDLIVLSSQTSFYFYSHDYSPPLNKSGLQIYALWKQEYHEIIGDKKTIYFFE